MIRSVIITAFLFATFSVVLVAQAQELSYEALQNEYRSQSRPLEYFEALCKEHESNPWVFHFRGLSEQESGLDQAALISFDKAQLLAPNQAWHWQTLGNHWVGRAAFGQAAFFYDKAAGLEQREAPAKALRDQAADARLRHAKKMSNLEAENTATMRVTVMGVLGLLIIGLLHFFGPRLIK
ncbi:MAG: tetratricopeptide (TPR) repeat protein [Planctomycetota bacterium]